MKAKQCYQIIGRHCFIQKFLRLRPCSLCLAGRMTCTLGAERVSLLDVTKALGGNWGGTFPLTLWFKVHNAMTLYQGPNTLSAQELGYWSFWKYWLSRWHGAQTGMGLCGLGFLRGGLEPEVDQERWAGSSGGQKSGGRAFHTRQIRGFKPP